VDFKTKESVANMASAGEKSFDIPKTHKAAIYDKPGEVSTKVVDVDTPDPGHGDVLVRLTHSGICHSDLAIMKSSWKMLSHPTQPGQIGGHEGVGVVVKLGPGSEHSPVKVGDRVGIKWVASVCMTCAPCLASRDGCCTQQKVSGYYYPGTFQQYAIGPANYVTPIPDGLDSAEAAPFLCAGVTSYASLKKSGVQAGEWAAIVGAGGGLGHLAVQLATRALGARVIGLDHGSKEAFVRENGAEEFLDITKHDDESLEAEVKKLTGGAGVHTAIVYVGSNKAYEQAMSLLRFGGTLVVVGVPHGDMVPIGKAFPQTILTRELRIVGVAVGNRKEAGEVLDFARRGVVKTHFKLEKLEKLTEVFKEMEEGSLVGRVVLDLQ